MASDAVFSRPLAPDRTLVFTDLDGTLLDHETYSFEAARTTLERLEELSVPVVFNSSKTAAELLPLRKRIGNRHPFIVENGAAVYVPLDYFSDPPLSDPGASAECGREGDFWVRGFGVDRDSILAVLHKLRADRGLLFEGFADWTDEEIAGRTGLSVEDAALARRRRSSEPILWEGPPDSLDYLLRELAASELRAVQGGRFLHVMGRFDKRDGVDWLRERYRRERQGRDLDVVALGDSPNDLGMLEAADVAVIVRSARSDHVDPGGPRRILRTEKSGPAGWREAFDELLPSDG